METKLDFQTLMRRRLAKLEDEKLYDADEIVDRKLIVNSKLESHRYTVYRLIQRKKMPAINVGTDTQPRWKVKGKDLKTYVEKQYALIAE